MDPALPARRAMWSERSVSRVTTLSLIVYSVGSLCGHLEEESSPSQGSQAPWFNTSHSCPWCLQHPVKTELWMKVKVEALSHHFSVLEVIVRYFWIAAYWLLCQPHAELISKYHGEKWERQVCFIFSFFFFFFFICSKNCVYYICNLKNQSKSLLVPE